jgi:transposase-like protein
MGRIRLHVALDCSAYSLETFILDNVAPGSTIVTDSWRSYNFLEDAQWSHEKSNQSRSKCYENLYGVHLITSLIKRLLRGTFHGRFESKYLQNYLDEYVFRFNRRKSKSIGKKFMRIVQQVVNSTKVTYSKIVWDMDPISEYFVT